VVPLGAVPPQAGPVSPPLAVPAKKRRKWPWVLVGLFLLIFVLPVLFSGGSKTPATPTSLPAAPTVKTFNGAPVDAAPAQAAPAVVAPAPLQPSRKITAREWQLIAKAPDSHVGERVIVYGQVTQFDATTGGEGFRANVDGVVHKPQYGYADYDTNTLLQSDDASVLADVVQDDLFKAEVTVTGSKSYTTVMGGNITAPQLAVTKIETIGHV
jgi:hypothetical protein